MQPRLKILLAVTAIFLFGKIAGAQHAVSYGPDLNGFRLGADSLNHYYIMDPANFVMVSLDSIDFGTDEVIEQIKGFAIADRLLIVRVLEMHVSPSERKKELLNTTRSYDEIALLVLNRALPMLKK